MFLARQGRLRAGFTLIEIIIVVAIIGIILAASIAGYVRAQDEARAKACQENQAKAEGAVREYMLSNNTSVVPGYDLLVGDEGQLTVTPRCPATGQAIPLPMSSSGLTHCPTNEPGHQRSYSGD